MKSSATNEASVPAGGKPDLSYLGTALCRAGRTLDADAVELATLAGGRSGQPVYGLRALRRGEPAGRYVVKVVSASSARPRATGCGCIEANLWHNGVMQSLPAPLSCPTIDVAREADGDRWWILMDDVSDGILPRGVFDAERLTRMVRALAGMHAAYWERGNGLAGVVATLDATTAALAEPVLFIARGRQVTDWVSQFVDETPHFRAFVPPFLDVLGASDADFYLALCEHRSPWLAPLDAQPKTLTQGDLRRANVAIFADRVSLFDWDLATYAPAACDLLWYWFLQFWAYPPSDGLLPEAREPLRQTYIDALDSALGGGLDRPAFDKSWDLAWLRTFVQLGCCLADPIAGDHTAADRARVEERCARAIGHARRIVDKHVR
jgi:hypothetical protein